MSRGEGLSKKSYVPLVDGLPVKSIFNLRVENFSNSKARHAFTPSLGKLLIRIDTSWLVFFKCPRSRQS